MQLHFPIEKTHGMITITQATECEKSSHLYKNTLLTKELAITLQKTFKIIDTAILCRSWEYVPA